jgi:hypothetical protein
MDGLIYYTSFIVVLLDRRDIKIWSSAWGRSILANMAKENTASLATLAKKNYCPDIFEAITPYKIPGRILPNPV